MSYSTKVELLLPTASGRKRPSGIEARLDELGIHHEVIDDLDRVFKAGKGSLRIHPTHIDEVMKWISQQQPAVRYVLRGRGEDEDASWTREYRDGAGAVSEYKPRVTTTRAAKAARAAIANIGEAAPYTPQTRYSVGDAIEHPSFGKGLVSQVQPTKILVQFGDAERTLVHGRGG